MSHTICVGHGDIIKCKHFLRWWSFVWGIHWSPVNSSHKGQWWEALIFSLICRSINIWENNCEAGDLRCHFAHYDAMVIWNNYKTINSQQIPRLAFTGELWVCECFRAKWLFHKKRALYLPFGILFKGTSLVNMRNPSKPSQRMPVVWSDYT